MRSFLFRRALPLLITGAVAVGAAAPVASAEDAINAQGLSNFNSGLQLDMRGASQSRGAIAIQYHPTGWAGLFLGDNQRWFLPRPDDQVPGKIKNLHSGLCLRTDGVAGHAIYQDYCSDYDIYERWQPSSPTTWRFWVGGSNPVYFQNPATGLVLDVNQASKSDSAAVIGWYYNGGPNQAWQY